MGCKPKTSLEAALQGAGFSQREYLDLCGTVAMAAGMEETQALAVGKAMEAAYEAAQAGKLYPVIWLEGASCSGCTESFAQLASPGIAAVVLEMISLNYADLLAAGAGSSVEEAKERTLAAGNYLLIYEGAISLAEEGHALRSGGAPGFDLIDRAAAKASAVVALGSCAVDGGWMAAPPNPAAVVGVETYLKSRGISVPVINIPGCPANPDWLFSVLARVVMLGGVDTITLDAKARPLNLFHDTVHENCARHQNFEAGNFAFSWDTPETAQGFCLYGLGCQGPQTKALCGITLWNNRRSWCVDAGAPCIGCCDAAPGDISWFARNQGVDGAARRAVAFNPQEGCDRTLGDGPISSYYVKPWS